MLGRHLIVLTGTIKQTFVYKQYAIRPKILSIILILASLSKYSGSNQMKSNRKVLIIQYPYCFDPFGASGDQTDINFMGSKINNLVCSVPPEKGGEFPDFRKQGYSRNVRSHTMKLQTSNRLSCTKYLNSSGHLDSQVVILFSS